MKAEQMFDCVKAKHKGGLQIYEQIKNMTKEEELEFWEHATKEIEATQKKMHNKSLHPTVC
ncbi:MAG: hypothetical protein CV045_12120 [Cyanobacteria bacterium M5B4]|nr:MAG: hypothetical protein CV045_12120 [Cyanobacteria bacterium M5B4]